MSGQRSDREMGIDCLMTLGASREDAEAYFDVFRRPRCTACEGTGDSPTSTDDDRVPCSHCGGTGHEPEDAS